MIIRIESIENGWATERRIELEDDQRLVQTLLRAVKRKRDADAGDGSPADGAGAGGTKPCYAEAPGTPEREGQSPPHAEDPGDSGAKEAAQAEGGAADPPGAEKERAPGPPQPAGEGGYKGFLLIACGGCGKVTAYNSRLGTREFVCRTCGHVTPLEALAEVEMRCRACNEAWRYKTNCTGAEVYCGCIGCGAELRARWHKKLRRYVPA